MAEEKKYSLHIHKTPFVRKPGLRDVRKINDEIVSEIADVSQRRLSELVGQKGHTMVLATMNGSRKKDNMVQQEVVAIDFDNTETRTDAEGKLIKDERGKAKKFKTEGEKYTSIKKILTDSFAKENASFIYKTFSHKDDWERFRVVFFLDKPLQNNRQTEAVYGWLMNKYKNADPANKDSSRLFYGGTESIEIKYGNEIRTDEIKVQPPKKEVSLTTAAKTPVLNNVQKLKSQESLAMLESYIERERENLQDYNNALSAIWVIGKAAKTGEISIPAAVDYCRMLALGNEDWEQNNQVKLQEALDAPIHEIHTEYTFAQKFGGKKTTAVLDRSDMIVTSKYLVDVLDIKLYKNSLYFKQGNHWIHDDNKLLRAVDDYIELKRTQDNELISQFQKRAELIEQESFPIQFRNDFMFDGNSVSEGTTEGFTPYLLDVLYNPKAYNSDVDGFLDFLTCGRNDIRTVIEEMLGHILMTQGFPHKIFFFVGEKGANGKSTFFEMLNNFVGELSTNISLENFNDPTSVGELEGKLVNIADDIDASYMEKSQNFKTLASGNTIMIRPIYERPYRLKNRATLIFTANEMPSFKDKTGGIGRRLVIVPCENEVKEADFTIDEKLSTDEAKSYLLNLALQGLSRMKQNGGRLSESETMINAVSEYLTESDSILTYLLDNEIDEDLPTSDVYEEYAHHSLKLGQKPFSHTKFTQRLKTLGYETRQVRKIGKRYRAYEKIEK